MSGVDPSTWMYAKCLQPGIHFSRCIRNMATPCLEKIVSPLPSNEDEADTKSTNKDTTRHKKKKQQREFDFSM